MDSPWARPQVADLVFRLYIRALHPELFDVFATRRIERETDRLTVQITRTGHTLSWSSGNVQLTETTATADQELPEFGRRLAHPFRGERGGRCAIRPGIRYQVGSHVEVLPPEQFLQIHQELLIDGTKKGLLFQFHPHNRLRLSPLGVVIVESLPRCLCISAFHTFPDEFAVVKTQSLIEQV
jgi:hypothetical protein